MGYAGGPGAGTSTPAAAYGPYTRLYGRYTQYWPLPSSFYLQGRLELGRIIVKDGIAIPDAEQWRAGGEDSVRGYSWRSLAPTVNGNIVGGNFLATTSVEIAHPFTSALPSVWWAAFVDAGSAAQRYDTLDPAARLRAGRALAQPRRAAEDRLSWGQQVHRGRLDLSIGVAF